MKFITNRHLAVCLALLIILAFAHVAVRTLAEGGNVTYTVTDPRYYQALEAFSRLQNNEGSIKSQRSDIELLSRALNDEMVTSEHLGQKGEWLHDLRRRVDVREAVEASWKLRLIEAEEGKASKAKLSEANKLMGIASPQVYSYFAKEEGLKETHASLWRIMKNIREKGGETPQ